MNLTIALAALLASAVEFVEALTIVLAVGVIHGWKTAGTGATAGVAILALLIIVLGPAFTSIPIHALQFIIGAALLFFGLRWLRKAILRSSGHKALHDEEQAYQKTLAEQSAHKGTTGLNPFGFSTALNGVFLEGLEVAFIVITMGSASGSFLSALSGASAGLILVLMLGFLFRSPLTKVPENLLKYVVGVMLSAFGTLWTGAGLGIHWWFSDSFVFVLVAVYLLFAQWQVLRLKKTKEVKA